MYRVNDDEKKEGRRKKGKTETKRILGHADWKRMHGKEKGSQE